MHSPEPHQKANHTLQLLYAWGEKSKASRWKGKALTRQQKHNQQKTTLPEGQGLGKVKSVTPETTRSHFNHLGGHTRHLSCHCWERLRAAPGLGPWGGLGAWFRPLADPPLVHSTLRFPWIRGRGPGRDQVPATGTAEEEGRCQAKARP